MSEQVIPDEIFQIYKPLFNQVCHLHSKWEIFCELYASEKETLSLLNKSAGGFFRVVQDVLAHDILLNLSCLTDPAQTRHQDNLSLFSLVGVVAKQNYPKIKCELDRLVTEARSHCDFARVIRNKLIAHNDLQHTLEQNGVLISFATKQKIELAMESIRNTMNCVARYFEGGDVIYQLASMPNGAKSLIRCLKKNAEYLQQLREMQKLY